MPKPLEDWQLKAAALETASKPVYVTCELHARQLQNYALAYLGIELVIEERGGAYLVRRKTPEEAGAS